jgi:hypothetical protein
MLSPTLKFLRWFEYLEAFEIVKMVVVGEDGCTDFLGAGSDEDVLRGECYTGSVKRPSAGGGLFPDFIGGRDVNQDIKKGGHAVVDFFDSQAALDLQADHAAGGKVAIADPVAEDFGGVETAAEESDVNIAVHQHGRVHFLALAAFLEP